MSALLASLEKIQPGFSLINEKIQSIRSGKFFHASDLSQKDVNVIREKFDDYLMYIWLHLGDNNFNRQGYRKATDILCNELKIK